jgi:hypothetical protein
VVVLLPQQAKKVKAPYAFVITLLHVMDDSDFQISAPTESERDEWANALRKVRLVSFVFNGFALIKGFLGYRSFICFGCWC